MQLTGSKPHPALVICMGVSGCGKSSVAHAVAEATGLRFFEADDFHSEENRTRMASGKPLDDSMREPWIENIRQSLRREFEAGNGCVLACSALRRHLRDRLRDTEFRTLFLFLDGEREAIASWMKQREDHFMPVALLDSQFKTLEPPLEEPDTVRIAITGNWDETVKTAIDLSRDFIHM